MFLPPSPLWQSTRIKHKRYDSEQDEISAIINLGKSDKFFNVKIKNVLMCHIKTPKSGNF